MKNKTLLFISFILISLYLDAQREGYNWHFGSNAYVDFNTVPPTPYATSNMDQREGCASISSPSGDVLFYTDGMSVWNKNDVPMIVPGGGGIGGQNTAAQSSIIVPVPSQPDRYYIFTVRDWTTAGAGLRYSEVNMNLNGGLGGLVSVRNPLNARVREQVTSVDGANGDVWIVSHEQNNSDYVVYNISSAGVLNPNPVRTSVGMFYGGGNRYGYLKFSQDGNKLCNTFGSMNSFAGPTVQLLDFNKATGVLSNPITLGTTTAGDIRFAYSSEFSPDNTKLYVAEFGRNDIFQFDISLGSPALIVASRINIGTGNSRKNCLQIGPCNKIYVSGQNNTFLGVINFPDNAGAACDFDEQGLQLVNGSNAMLGLPNFKRSFFAFPNLGQDTAICSGQTLALNSNMLGASYLWNTGSTQPSININSTGLYTVDVSAYGCEYSDSIYVRVNPSPVATANNNGPLCVGDQLLLTGGSNGLSYSWSGPSTYNSVSQSPVVGTATTAMSGSYSLVVTDVNSCSSLLTTNVTVNSLPNVSAGVDDSICDGGSVGLVASGATTYSWNNSGSLTSSVISNPTANPSTTTTYTLTGTDVNQCVNTDNVTVTVNANPVATANNNGPLCVGDQLILAGGANGLSYSWSGPNTYSSASQSSVVSGNAMSTMSGTYTLTVSDGNKCTGIASTTIVINANPVATANNNGPLCVGDQLILAGGS
ncbi:MAG TPA: hypothetical protein EYQ86_01850, partial [Bacteroidetes bacterium]|nr:hypothetical protein [Bacteroidota bacterium]